MTYNCECCNFITDIKANYNRHLNTNKHIQNTEISTNNAPIITNNAPIITNNAPIITNNIYTCDYCNSNYTKLSSLNRHQKKCVKQIILEKDKQIELFKQNNNKLLETFNQAQNEIKQLNKTIHSIKDKQLSVLQKNLKPNNNNNTQVIINNYPNAPNIGFPDDIKVDKSLNQYVQLGGVKGLGKFISDHWAKDINHIDRSIWMVDPSRNKFLIRHKNSWVIDMDGIQFQELNLEKIQNIFNEYLKKYEFDTYDYLKTMEFIIDIRTKNMIVKGLKNAGKYLVYDKEKFIDFETIENEIIDNEIIENETIENETIVD